MAFAFPAGPNTGDTYTGPNNVTYTFDGAKWVGASYGADYVKNISDKVNLVEARLTQQRGQYLDLIPDIHGDDPLNGGTGVVSKVDLANFRNGGLTEIRLNAPNYGNVSPAGPPTLPANWNIGDPIQQAYHSTQKEGLFKVVLNGYNSGGSQQSNVNKTDIGYVEVRFTFVADGEDIIQKVVRAFINRQYYATNSSPRASITNPSNYVEVIEFPAPILINDLAVNAEVVGFQTQVTPPQLSSAFKIDIYSIPLRS